MAIDLPESWIFKIESPYNAAENPKSALAPVYLLDDFHTSEQIHNHDTRNKDLIRLPLANTTKFQTSFQYNAAKSSWNTLPRNLCHDQSLTSFKLRVKKFPPSVLFE